MRLARMYFEAAPSPEYVSILLLGRVALRC